jgi:DNA repair protein RadC
VKGIGFVKACQIKAVFELGNRVESYCEEMHPRITSKDDVVKLLAPHVRYLKQEEFRVLLLDHPDLQSPFRRSHTL